MWIQAYDAVTTKGGRFVQGGGCTTVGVAGLVQGGGFGSFSKGYGTAAASLLEAEIVTADGAVRIANPRTNSDLFWAIKGGGGGTFGVITRLTLRTHVLPPFFGSVQMEVSANSDAAFRRLVERIMSFYRTNLLNPHWGDQITFGFGRRVSFSMLFQGIDQRAAEETWRPFFDWVTEAGADYAMAKPMIRSVPARYFWDGRLLKTLPGVVVSDDRPGAPPEDIYWTGDAVGVGSVVHAYQSAWLPSALLEPDRMAALVDALVKAAMTWNVALHCSKGIAGAAPDTVAAVKDTATNPAVLEAFALAISGSGGPPAYPGIVGHEAGLADPGHFARRVGDAMAPIKRLLAAPASYVAESDYFETDWRTAYWGSNAARLEAIKERYDPGGLFFVHHGVGSEHWSSDGFTRLA
jgi:FAD/FMN-containing dehydrogenase